MSTSTTRTNDGRRDVAHRALKRLLANGRLTAVPKRPADQELLVALAASCIDAQRDCAESEVNERLKSWLETISEPHGIDHVTLRRLVVDTRFLTRTSSGSAYRVNPDKFAELAAIRDIEPAEVLAGLRDERQRRKQKSSA